MEIVQVAPQYYPRVGGVETHVQKISERLVQRGHDVTVITADAGRDVPSKATINGVTVRRYRGASPNEAFHVAPGIAPAVSRVRSDVVHAHNYHGLPLFFAAAAVGDTPFVTTPHYHAGSSSRFRDRLLDIYRPLGRWAIKRSDAVIAVSNWEAAQLAADFDVRAEVIPNGIMLDRFSSVPPEQRRAPYVLTVGRLQEYKGVQYAIRALAQIPEYELVVAGKGPYKSTLEQVAIDAGVEDRVSFEGYVDDDRLPRLYAGADVYVTLSEFEAFGLTVGEALASGTPCVVRESGALVDWTNRPDCVGVTSMEPGVITNAVDEAKKLDAPHPDYPLADWDEVTDHVEALYHSIVE